MKPNLKEKQAHTPGPWGVKQTAVYDAVYGPNDELISFMGIREPQEIQANARLIAAAPDMLLALEALEKMVSDLPMPAVKNVIAHAIAKAEGRQ